MIARFSEAFRLLWHHLGLFTAIILTVWLPGNILIEYLAYYVIGSSEGGFRAFTRMTTLIDAIFGPISIGALIYALYQIKSGRTVAYRDAIAIGFKKWRALFTARIMAGILIGLGLIALLIPGMVLAVRYSLLAPAVVIESRGASQSSTRSTELTEGRRWQIFWTAVLFFVPYMVMSYTISFALGLVESLDIMPVAVVLDCLLDVAYAVLDIVIFLFYWEATQEQRRAGASVTWKD